MFSGAARTAHRIQMNSSVFVVLIEGFQSHPLSSLLLIIPSYLSGSSRREDKPGARGVRSTSWEVTTPTLWCCEVWHCPCTKLLSCASVVYVTLIHSVNLSFTSATCDCSNWHLRESPIHLYYQ